MKFFSFLVTLIIFGGAAYYVYNNQEFVMDKVSEILDKIDIDENPGLTSFVEELNGELDTVVGGDPVVIKFNMKSPLDMDDAVYSVAKEAYEIYGKPIRVEGSYNGEPILALVSDDLNIDFSLEDIRRPKYMIETDIGIFDVLVDQIDLTQDEATITLEYYGTEEDFWSDYAGISFVTVQDVPGLEKITLKYVKPGFCFSVTTATDALLRYYADEITETTFIESLETSKC